MVDHRAPRWSRQRLGLIAGAVLFGAFALVPPPPGLSAPGMRTAAMAILMAVWWISEAIPIPVTALCPLALSPLLGSGTIEETAAPYAHPIIFLFMGGFMLALAMQRWDLHRRIALRIIRSMGTRPKPLVAGFMTAAAFLSMWVSNTATAMMMLPIGLSVIQLAGESGEGRDSFAVALLLGLAYACSIGGLGTLIGTPPNAFLAAFMSKAYDVEITFLQWMAIGIPMVAIGLPLSFLLLTRVAFPLHGRELVDAKALVARELAALGPAKRGEKMVGCVFAVTALAWISRPLLARWVAGLSDPGIAIAAAITLFLLPVDLKRREFVLDWEWARRVPWGVLLLLGGGLSLADAIQRTGLAEWIATALQGLASWPGPVIVLAACALIVLLTEFTSNTATAAAFLPVLAAVAKGAGHHPLLLALPAGMAASCAFLLPVATPPNAIVYGSNRLTIPDMIRAGIWLELLFIGLITALTYTLVPVAFGIDIFATP